MSKENDPDGKSPHTSGAKLDSGKIMTSQILGHFPRALTAVAEVGTFGANKYTLNGWEEVENAIPRYEDAMMRHYFKEKEGEARDPDSNLLHAAHRAWNALATLELLLRSDSQKEKKGFLTGIELFLDKTLPPGGVVMTDKNGTPI